MKFDPNIHRRRSIRLKGYDYSQAGAYFVTIVTWQRECLFGDVVEGVFNQNNFGLIANFEWKKLSKRFSGLYLDHFVIMPNHMHGIIMIEMEDLKLVTHKSATQKIINKTSNHPFSSPKSLVDAKQQTLGSIVGAYKSTVARYINGLRKTPGAMVWQRNYYERIIRNEKEFNNIQGYIEDNPARWEEDELFSI